MLIAYDVIHKTVQNEQREDKQTKADNETQKNNPSNKLPYAK